MWLLDPDSEVMQAVGLVSGGSARLPVLPSLDLDRYRVVDVSLETLDGDAAHRAESLLRGDLTAE